MINKNAVVVLVCGMLAVTAVRGYADVSEAYLYSTWTAPTNQSVASFTFTGTDGVRMFLNGSGVATGQVDIASSSSNPINFAFTYLSNTGTINFGEGFAQNSAAMGTRVNSEIGRIDDVGFVTEGSTDAPLNADFGSAAQIVLQKFNNGLTCIMIAEDAGLDPFQLEWDADGNFASGAITLFNGFNSGTQTAILNRSDFGGDDSGSDIDQVYILKFNTPLEAGYLRLTENGNPDSGSARLEVDFAGGNCIPEPSTVVTVGLSLGLMGMVLRRRR